MASEQSRGRARKGAEPKPAPAGQPPADQSADAPTPASEAAAEQPTAGAPRPAKRSKAKPLRAGGHVNRRDGRGWVLDSKEK